jgi:hypothetical protein
MPLWTAVRYEPVHMEFFPVVGGGEAWEALPLGVGVHPT